MTLSRVFRRIELHRILFLTDFTEPSDQAIPYAASFARGYDSEILALHVLTGARPDGGGFSEPSTWLDRAEQAAEDGMTRVDAQLAGLRHESLMLRETSVWPAVRKTLDERHIDLIVAGSHRRRGVDGLMHQSIAEEVFRRASVPVLVVGPYTLGASHTAGAFRRILFATDFSAESAAAVPFAVSLAEEHDSKLLLLHVLPHADARSNQPREADSVAHVMHSFHESIPADVELWCRPEGTVRFGDPAAEILETASDLRADLIVLGVRRACDGRCEAARDGRCDGVRGNGTPPRTIARAVVAGAKCPLLAVRGVNAQQRTVQLNSAEERRRGA